jgi:hypothetical protein
LVAAVSPAVGILLLFPAPDSSGEGVGGRRNLSLISISAGRSSSRFGRAHRHLAGSRPLGFPGVRRDKAESEALGVGASGVARCEPGSGLETGAELKSIEASVGGMVEGVGTKPQILK